MMDASHKYQLNSIYVKKNKKSNQMSQLKEALKRNNISFEDNDDILNDFDDISSSDDESTNKDYKWKISSSSCEISNIKNLIFGAFSSRFWLFRKYMNQMKTVNFKTKSRIPFYSWDCLTI